MCPLLSLSNIVCCLSSDEFGDTLPSWVRTVWWTKRSLTCPWAHRVSAPQQKNRSAPLWPLPTALLIFWHTQPKELFFMVCCAAQKYNHKAPIMSWLLHTSKSSLWIEQKIRAIHHLYIKYKFKIKKKPNQLNLVKESDAPVLQLISTWDIRCRSASACA